MRKQQDELRARFTVFIQHVIIHARISYLRQIQKTAFEISFSEIKNTPVQDFDTQYKEFMTDRLNFNFEEDTFGFHIAEMLIQQSLTPWKTTETTSAIDNIIVPGYKRRFIRT